MVAVIRFVASLRGAMWCGPDLMSDGLRCHEHISREVESLDVVGYASRAL